MKVTANNIWKVVKRVTRSKVTAHAAARFDLQFHPDPAAGPSWALPTFSVMVSQQMLEHGDVSIREILAMEINKYFKVGTTSSALPVHLHGYLNTPDEELLLPQNMEWKQDNDDYFKPPGNSVSGQTVTGDLSRYIPGVRAVVDCPCQTPAYHQGEIVSLVQHLNDSCGYTREMIADWLETLEVDLTFPSEPPPPKELPPAKRDELLVIFGPTLAAVTHETRRRRRRPQDVVQVSAHQGHLRVAELLRGRRGFQYVVLPGTYVHEDIAALFAYSEATEVGEEEDWASQYEGSSVMNATIKQIWAPQIEKYLQPPLVFKPPAEGVEIKFIKSAHMDSTWTFQWIEQQIAKQVAQHIDLVLYGAPKSGKHWLGGGWKDEAHLLGGSDPWPEQAETLMANLKALEGSEHEQDVLWLADPQILGEHLPAVKDEPKPVEGGHAILPGTHSPWYSQFTKPSWQKKEH